MCLSKANIWPVKTRESDNVILSLKLIRFIIFEFFEIAYLAKHEKRNDVCCEFVLFGQESNEFHALGVDRKGHP